MRDKQSWGKKRKRWNTGPKPGNTNHMIQRAFQQAWYNLTELEALIEAMAKPQPRAKAGKKRIDRKPRAE